MVSRAFTLQTPSVACIRASTRPAFAGQIRVGRVCGRTGHRSAGRRSAWRADQRTRTSRSDDGWRVDRFTPCSPSGKRRRAWVQELDLCRRLAGAVATSRSSPGCGVSLVKAQHSLFALAMHRPQRALHRSLASSFSSRRRVLHHPSPAQVFALLQENIDVLTSSLSLSLPLFFAPSSSPRLLVPTERPMKVEIIYDPTKAPPAPLTSRIAPPPAQTRPAPKAAAASA